MEAQKVQTKERKIPCEVYSRVVGYLRPVRNWNNGKKQEFTERKTFEVNQSRIND
jgi:anaerobic ribonucleoside-triphosphate reductase